MNPKSFIYKIDFQAQVSFWILFIIFEFEPYKSIIQANSLPKDKYSTFSQRTIIYMIDFNGMSTHQESFYALKIGIHFHCIPILTFSILLFLKR